MLTHKKAGIETDQYMSSPSEFISAMLSAGLTPPDHITPGRIHRFPGEGKGNGNKAGWCILFDDGDGGVYGDWSTGLEGDWHHQREFTQQEKIEFARKRAQARATLAQEREKIHNEAVISASELWGKAKPEMGEHKYLRDKNIKPYGVKTDNYNLLIPIYNSDKKLCSIQTINPNGDKLFHKGGRVKGCYYPIGKADSILCLAEGFATGAAIHEATGHAVAVCFNAGNLQPVAEALSHKLTNTKIIVCADDDLTEGNPGLNKAREAAASIGGFVAKPTFGDDRPDGLTDFNDMAKLLGNGAVAEAINQAVENTEPHELSEGIPYAELAMLSPVEYDKCRAGIAEKEGIRVSTLDAEIKKYQVVNTPEEDSIIEKLEPWPDPISGYDLLNDLTTTISNHVILPKGSAAVLAIWILGAYTMDAWRIWPKILISSPEKRCGKTTLLEALEGLVPQSLITSGVTAAALFRCIEAWNPTLLIDEADTFLADNAELNGIINAGHNRRGAFVIRAESDGNTFTPTRFNVWCPMVIAGIGQQRGTLQDRSIKVEMRRKLPGESVQRMPIDFFERNQALRQKCIRWAQDNLSKLKGNLPTVPTCGNDRAEDNWQPLFAVAEVAGGKWPDRVLAAYQIFAYQDADDESIGAKLLSDIRDIFEDKNQESIFSRELIAALVEMEDRPWCEWKHGKPLTQNSLSRLLSPYKIKTKNVRLFGKVGRGFNLQSFEKTWDRYLSSPELSIQSATVLQSPSHAGCSPIQSATQDQTVALQKPLKATSHAGCSTVALENPGEEEWEAQL